MLRLLVIRCSIVAVVSLLPALALAGATDSSTVIGADLLETDSVGSMVVRLVLSLAAIIALIVLTLWGVRRLQGRRWTGKMNAKPIQVIDRVHLAPKRSLDVIAVGDRILLLGVTENGINLLTELTADEKNQLETTQTASGGFQPALEEARNRLQQAFRHARTKLPGELVTSKANTQSS